MQLNLELGNRHYEKLQQLQHTVGKDARTVLELAIDELYARHQVAVGPDALEIFRKNGFVACGHFEAGLPEKAASFSEKGTS